MMKPWQTPLNKAHPPEKEWTKREDSSPNQKNITQIGSQKCTGTNRVAELPFSKGWVRKERNKLDLTLQNFLRSVLKLFKTLGYPQYIYNAYKYVNPFCKKNDHEKGLIRQNYLINSVKLG